MKRLIARIVAIRWRSRPFSTRVARGLYAEPPLVAEKRRPRGSAAANEARDLKIGPWREQNLNAFTSCRYRESRRINGLAQETSHVRS
jgi:hypothetical protein